MICRIITLLFLAYYLFALFLLAVGTFGWFGAEHDPLSGIFLLPAGLPWNLLADRVPDPYTFWLGILAPLLNQAILIMVCKMTANRRHGRAAG